MKKILLILFLTIIPLNIFGNDIVLVCKINKKSRTFFFVSVYEYAEELFVDTDDPRHYGDTPIKETYYYKVNFEDKVFTNLNKTKKNLYNFIENVSIYKNYRIDLTQDFKDSPNSKEFVYNRVRYNKYNGEFWSNKMTVTKSRTNAKRWINGDPIKYNQILKYGLCSKIKNFNNYYVFQKKPSM